MIDTAIVIPTRNRSALLAQTVESLDQCSPTHRIVINDASEDDTQTVCRDLYDAGKIHTVFRNCENEGVARSVNCGLRFAYRQGFQFFGKVDDDITFNRGDWIDLAKQAVVDFPWIAYVAVPIVPTKEPGHTVTHGKSTIRIVSKNVNGGAYIQTRRTLETLGYRFQFPGQKYFGCDAARDHMAWHGRYEVAYLPSHKTEWATHHGTGNNITSEQLIWKTRQIERFKTKYYPQFLRKLQKNAIKLPVHFGIKEVYPELHSGGDRYESFDYALQQIGPVSKVLYVGANHLRRQLANRFDKEHVTILEAFGKNVEFHRKHGWKVIHGDVRRFNRGGWDLILWWHGPEHVGKDEVKPTLEKLKRLGKSVVVGSPKDFMPQSAVYGNPFEVHRCHMNRAMLLDCGFKVWESEDNRTGVWQQVITPNSSETSGSVGAKE